MSISLLLFLAVLAAGLLSMAVFAALGKRRDPDAVSKNAQFVGGAGDFLLHWFLWVVDPAARWSIRLGLTADFYNFAGLVTGAIAGVAMGLGWLEWGGWALALSGVCDILDGRVARATAKTSAYGAFIDSVLDRFIELFVFMGLAAYLGRSAAGALIVATALGGSFLVSYTRAMGETLGVECTGGLLQRGERLLLLCLAAILDPSVSSLALHRPPGLVMTAVLVFIGLVGLATAVHRSFWIAGRLLARSAPDAAEPKP
jgi:CDP-diacylglycerol--glycerol-3-phosphate 3-phosphatidyltransferase